MSDPNKIPAFSGFDKVLAFNPDCLSVEELLSVLNALPPEDRKRKLVWLDDAGFNTTVRYLLRPVDGDSRSVEPGSLFLGSETE